MEDDDKHKKEILFKKLQDMKPILKKVLLEKDELKEHQAVESNKAAKKMKDLKDLLSIHDNKIKTLNTEIKDLEENIKMKHELMKLKKNKSEKEYRELLEKIEKYWQNYNEVVSFLEEKVKNAYLIYQNERDAKILLSGVNRKLKGDIKHSIQFKVLKEKKKLEEKRVEDIKKEQAKLRENTKSASEAIEVLEKRKELLERQNQSLKEAFLMAKEAEERSAIRRL